jgi:hypothetical protein
LEGPSRDDGRRRGARPPSRDPDGRRRAAVPGGAGANRRSGRGGRTRWRGDGHGGAHARRSRLGRNPPIGGRPDLHALGLPRPPAPRPGGDVRSPPLREVLGGSRLGPDLDPGGESSGAPPARSGSARTAEIHAGLAPFDLDLREREDPREGRWPHGGGLVEVPGAKARLEIQPLRTTRVVGYAPALSKVRPIADRILRALGRPGLPPPGTVLSEAFATEVEWRGRSALGKLVDGIRHASGASGARLVHWGLPADHPDLPWLKARLRAWETRSVVYAVHDPRRPFLAPRDLRVEVARL